MGGVMAHFVEVAGVAGVPFKQGAVVHLVTEQTRAVVVLALLRHRAVEVADRSYSV